MKLELGTYVDCSNLTDEQRQKLLDKFVELVGSSCDSFDKDISDFCHVDKFLVYGISYENEKVIWFWDHPLGTGVKKSYHDFFPEDSEQPLVQRPKTIDLERKTEEELIGALFVQDGWTVDSLISKLSEYQGNGAHIYVKIKNGDINIYREAYAESEEAYQQRVAREKQLNDWYTQELMKVTKRAMSLEQDLDDVSAILNGQTTLGDSQVMDIKKIIGGK